MKASKLIAELQIKIEKYGDEEINIRISKGFGDYEKKEIISTSHQGEDGLFINT